MPVVINEFEVVTGEGTPGQPEAALPAGEAGEKQPPSPREIERLFEQQMQRCERVWAH
jgi:hypothetical protein